LLDPLDPGCPESWLGTGAGCWYVVGAVRGAGGAQFGHGAPYDGAGPYS
jgi:hypothetical protein